MSAPKIKTTKTVVPTIYAYTTPEIKRHDGWTKIGYTEQEVGKRLDQQMHTADVEYRLEWRGNAIFDDGSGETFTDHDFHRHLSSIGIERKIKTEWFNISPQPAKEEFNKFRERKEILGVEQDTIVSYVLRKEQEEAVSKTLDYLFSHEGGEFLWNAKPRFGKTLAVYDLIRKMQAKKVLVVTNRPAISTSWYDDYTKFARDYLYFVTQSRSLWDRTIYKYKYDPDSAVIGDNPFLEFESLQDIKGSIYFGGNIDKFKHIAETKWDLLVIDEAHEGVDTFKTDVAFDHINRRFTLHLSGTPFKALANNKFEENAIYNWTYADEQKAKEKWSSEINNDSLENPYAKLPQLNLFTYQMSEMIKDVLKQGIDINGETEEYAFDLNEFFETSENDKRFKHEAAVNKFLDALTTQNKYPFSTEELRNELKHTLWLLDRVDSAKALADKLQKHPVFKEYRIVVAAGDGSINGEEVIKQAYNRVKMAIRDNDKTITLSVGQLTTGITIPEWTGVLMLSNVGSPALYMQTAFRAQNPCLFKRDGQCYRKEKAYVFDFDPARTLIIYEQFANDLNSNTTSGKGKTEERKENIKTLLNFFPVIGEDDEGEMIELDATKVLSIPRKIKANEVVKRGFLSNFLFQNISKIFQVPYAVTNILNKLPEMDEGKKANGVLTIEGDISEALSLDNNGEVKLSDEIINENIEEIFGEKIFSTEAVFDVVEKMDLSQGESVQNKNLELIKAKLSSGITDNMINTAKEEYGNEFTNAEQKRVKRIIEADINFKLNKAQSDFEIEKKKIEIEKDDLLNKAQTDEEINKIKEEFSLKESEAQNSYKKELKNVIEDTKKQTAVSIIERVETHKRNKVKQCIEEDIRSHLRGFSRTIPAFLMAYGDSNTRLANFDTIIPADVFKDVTSITIEEFKFLRDGGKFKDEKTGEIKYYEGHLFDEVVFNDSVQEFLNLKTKLSNYFDPSCKEDIFDYIPPQQTNQIFTPKKVVKEMVDLLEEENPGCFDDDSKTFADLYMKSGMYIAEIVKRLYNSEKMRELYPDGNDRLNHIFIHQVYGLAPTEIIYRICLSYILGFNKDIVIEKHNIRFLDTLPYAKDGTLEEELIKLFGL